MDQHGALAEGVSGGRVGLPGFRQRLASSWLLPWHADVLPAASLLVRGWSAWDDWDTVKYKGSLGTERGWDLSDLHYRSSA